MTEPEADLGADSPLPVDVTVTGGHFSEAVLGTQIVNKNTVVHQHAANVDAPALPPGQFRLSSHITVYENDPINRDSRIYRAKLHSEILGDLKIAVKILSDGERQRREAQIHFKVPHHINIVERILTDAFKYQGQSCIYIAMEQCDSQNLNAYVVSLVENNAPYDAEMFMSFAFQIATGLEFLHRHKILNRDLKPENILLSADKKIAKIADFGMGKEMTGEASTVSALQPGTDGWRSPEILKNVERITLASDMFSLGLILNFLWSYGKHAFGDDHHAWNLYIKRGENMTLDGLKIPNANAAKRLLRSLLSQNPAERPSALQVLRDNVFEESRLQSDSAAIYCGITVGNVRGSATIDSKANDMNESADMRSPGPTALDQAKKQDEKSETRLQSDSEAIHSGITVGKVQGSATIDSKAKDIDENATTADTRSLDSAIVDLAKGIEENVTTEATEKQNVSLGTTQQSRTNLAGIRKNRKEYGVMVQRIAGTSLIDIRKNLQGYGIMIRRTPRGFRSGIELGGRFNDQKVTIMQFDEDDVEKYENAVDVLTNLEHENIVHFIKEIPEICVILTEFCEYGTLKEYVAGAGKIVKLSELLRMAAQIASGMDFLHRKKYVHCGLRAANVVVTANLLCKISGFSTARHVGMRGGSSVGKNDILARWAAQEVLGKGYVSFKSDVWSFGVLLWEIVTRGDEPYPGMTEEHIGSGISLCNGHRMLKPKQCPSGFYFDIMRPCWNEDPDARPTFECLEKSLLSYDVEADQKEESVTVRALNDYTAVQEGDLSFKKGDIIVDCTPYSESGGWSRGTLDGKTGDFPSLCVVQIKTHEA